MVERQIRTFDVSDAGGAGADEIRAARDFRRLSLRFAGLFRRLRDRATGASPRELTAPLILARMLKEAVVRVTDRVLVVAGGSGYAAALVAGLAKSVYSLDEDSALSARAQANFDLLGLANAKSLTGALAEGAAAAGPFDLILLDGAATGPFDKLFSQLAEGGRMVTLVADARGARTGLATLFTRNEGAVSSRGLFSASAAPLKAFTAPAGFVF